MVGFWDSITTLTRTPKGHLLRQLRKRHSPMVIKCDCNNMGTGSGKITGKVIGFITTLSCQLCQNEVPQR